MSFRVNFFPIPYILVLILIVAFVAIFNETIYSYFAANFEINGAIVGLFVFCNIWILGTLAYYSRNARLLSRIFSGIGPVIEKQSIKKEQEANKSSMVLQPTYTIAGTLFDSPVFSGILAKLDRKNKLEVSKADADEVAQNILDNALRVLSPSKFIASVFILCGLIGTFFGLLETIGGVARALNTLASGGLTSDIGKFIKLLSDPLQGMSTAFSASLFGLTSALVSNFGNHVAWQKVLLFTTKVRNYLLSNTGVFDEDPTRITVRDLLISLEESFDMLYRGITNKLEDLTNHIATMGSVIVKTHERQEKMLRVILKDHELMEQFWKKFLLSEEGVMGIIDGISDRLSVVLPESMRKVFAPVLENMLDIMDNNAVMLERALEVAQRGVGVQSEIADISEETSKILEENTGILSKVNEELMGIHEKLNLDHMASLIAEGNGIKYDIANLINSGNELLNISNDLMKSSNEISLEGNKLTSGVIGGVDNNTAAVDEVLSALSATNSIVVDIRTINQHNRDLTQEGLHKQDISNNLNRGILEASVQSNSISSDTLLLLGNMLSESNDLSRSMLGTVSSIAQHNENIIKILDERFGMVIAFSSDLLSNANNTLATIMGLSESLMRCYDNQYLRLDNINHSIEGVTALVSNGLSIMDAGVNNSSAIIQRLDNGNELTIRGLQASNDILSSLSLANDTLGNVYSSATRYFNDSANFSALYVGMERQISSLLNSFLEFKGHFDGFLNTVSINTQTLSSINSLSSSMSERMAIVASILNEIAMSLNSLNGITGEHKVLSISIRDAIENVLGQSDALNKNVISLGGVFDSGVSKVIDGISVINSSSANYAQTMSELLDSIVTNLSTLAEVSTKVSSVIDINNQTSNTMLQISKQLDDAARDNKSHAAISEEVKNILINTDSNVMGIGNLLNNIKAEGDKVNEKLSNVIMFNNSQSEHNASVVKSNEKVEKYLDQIAVLINNLGIVYEKYGDSVKNGLDDVVKGIASVYQVSNEVSKLVGNINSLSSSIEKDVYGRANNEILSDVKDKLSNIISLKQNILTEFENTLSPALSSFDESFNIVSNRLSELSDIAEANKDILSRINSDASGKIFNQLSAVNNSIVGVDKHFKDLFAKLETINKIFDTQKDAFNNISDGLKDIKALAKDFNSIPKILNESASAIAAMNKTISSLDQNSGKVNESLLKFSSTLSDEIKSLASVMGQLDVTFKAELNKVGQNNSSLYDGVNKLISEISFLGNELHTSNDLDKLTNENFIKEINGSFLGISNSINDIKNTISNIVGNQLTTELSKIGANQQEMSYKLEKISPYVAELVKLVGNLNSASVNNDLVKVVNALDKINDADISNNAKLDILIKAVDTLIAEMLNSRNVSQAILDIIAELGGFKRVK